MNNERIPGLKALMLALSLTALLLPVSCSKDIPETGGTAEIPEGDLPIRFSLAGEDALKGALPTTNENLDSFGVFACHIDPNVYGPQAEDEYEPLGENLNFRYMLNVPYGWDESKKCYDVTPERFWPLVGNLTVFAYTPFMSNEKLQAAIAPGWTFGDGYPTIQWQPDTDPRKQVDISLAVASNVKRSLHIPLEFHHATSQIYFAANYIDLADGEFIVIDSVAICNIIGRKEVTVTDTPPYVNWEDDANLPRTEKYILTRREGLLTGEPIPQLEGAPRGDIITTDDGLLYLVPQKYDASGTDIELTVKYSLWYNDGAAGSPDEWRRTTIMECVMPNCVWEADKRYRYILSVHDRTEYVEVNVIEDYIGKMTTYFPMVLTLPYYAVEKSVGEEFDIECYVGPDEVLDKYKKVTWSLEPEDSDVAEITVVPNASETGPGFYNTHKLHVVCKQIGTVKINVATNSFASLEERKNATLDLTVGPKPATLADVPTVTYDWLDH